MSEQKLLNLAEAAVKLSELYIPKVNHAVSFMNAEAFEALNEFESAIRAYKLYKADGTE